MRRNNHGGIVSRTVVCALALSAALAGAPLTALAIEDPAVMDDTTEVTPVEEEPVEATPLAVTFYAEELEVEGVMADQIDYSGTGVALEPCSYRRAGYRFVGWRANTADGEIIYEDGATVPASDFGESGVLQLVALWEPISYTLVFDPAGGTLEVETLVCTYNEYVTYPVPQRPGYVFLGWALDSGVVLDSGNRSLLTTFDGDVVTLTALWEPTSVTIEFVPNYPSGAVGPSISSVSALYGEGGVSLPMLELEGYSFLGWDNGGEDVLVPGMHLVSEAFGSSFSNTATLTGVWAPHVYTLVCDYAGGSVTDSGGAMLKESAPLEVAYGSVVELPVPQRKGYVFAGWIDDNEVTYAKDAQVSNLSGEDGAWVTLTAIWQKEQPSADDASKRDASQDATPGEPVNPDGSDGTVADQEGTTSDDKGQEQEAPSPSPEGAPSSEGTGERESTAAVDATQHGEPTQPGQDPAPQTQAADEGTGVSPEAGPAESPGPSGAATVSDGGSTGDGHTDPGVTEAATPSSDRHGETQGDGGGVSRETESSPTGPTIVSATEATTSAVSEARVVQIADDATAMAPDADQSVSLADQQKSHGVLPWVTVVIGSIALLAVSASLVVSVRHKHQPGVQHMGSQEADSSEPGAQHMGSQEADSAE